MTHTVIVRQVDLDTATAALILGVTAADRIVAAPAGADPGALADPSVTCIEAGGSGQTHLHNFDHHDTDIPLPPACVQALAFTGDARPNLARLVDYAAAVDLGTPLTQRPAFPSLSAVFSGLRLTVSDPREQLVRGLDLLRTLLERNIDPFDTMPDLPGWRPYVAARREETAGLAEDMRHAVLFKTRSGSTAGFVESPHFGALGRLFRIGCQIAIACHPAFGVHRVRKITIGGSPGDIAALLPRLKQLSAGWGGPAQGTIIGSDLARPAPHPRRILRIVKDTL